MPKRTDISSILIIGAGPIVIGQAAEFDYSGSQAVKALKAEGYRVIVVNSNPATIMTDPELADATYIEPITPEVVAKIIEKEQPDALLPTMGGQTALNTALALAKDGTLERLGVQMIGANAEAIEKAEDRDQVPRRDGPDRARQRQVGDRAQSRRSAGGARTDGASGDHPAELHARRDRRRRRLQPRTNSRRSSARGSTPRPTTEVLIEESLLGWKEYEMEVVRDTADNAIIICSIENVDPMGVHTGDIITVAPALTLTDKEYQRMRSAIIAVLREIGVETGGSNVQFAVDPKTGRMIVIEMNPRVSRSSALASKATGFPIAKVAAKLAVGYTLDEIANDITGGATPASVRADDRLCRHQDPALRVREVQGRRATAVDRDEVGRRGDGDRAHLRREPAEGAARARDRACTGSTGCASYEHATPARDRECAGARDARPAAGRRRGAARRASRVERIHAIAGFDPWFLERLAEIVAAEEQVRDEGMPQRRRRAAAAEGDGLLRRAAGAAGAALGACRARGERGRGLWLGDRPRRAARR